MENLADTLCKLIKQATSDSVEPTQQQQAAEIVSSMVDQIPEIKNYISKDLKEYYESALSYTEADVKKRLHEFLEKKNIDFSQINCESEQEQNRIKKSFISWVLIILKHDCLDEYRKQKRRIKNNQPALINESLNKKLKDNQNKDSQQEVIDIISTENITLGAIEQFLKNNLKDDIRPAIINYIEEDPENKLKSCYPRNKFDCNCQVLLKRRLIDGESNINLLAEEFEVSRSTLQDYIEYRNNCNRADAKCFRLLIKEIEEKYQVNLKQYLD
jgi:uncharacterized membrane protein YheB (UPF0754 family)